MIRHACMQLSCMHACIVIPQSATCDEPRVNDQAASLLGGLRAALKKKQVLYLICNAVQKQFILFLKNSVLAIPAPLLDRCPEVDEDIEYEPGADNPVPLI